MTYVDEYRDMWELAEEVRQANEEIREMLNDVYNK